MSLAIETKDLSYSFRKGRPVLNGISLQVPEGSIYGFLGPNGAGKTTTIRMLAGMLISDHDNIFIRGRSLQQQLPGVFHSIGCLIETPSLYLHLTGRENLRIIATLRRLPESHIDHVLGLVGLTRAASRKAKEYSLGMKQRLGIAMALLPDPKLLVLDEPVNGLDPNGMIEVRELLIRLNKEEGKTVFLSSHLLHEIEKSCTHIGIIHKGTMRYQGTLSQMKQTAYAEGEVVFRIGDAAHWFYKVAQEFPGIHRQAQDEIVFPFSGQEAVPVINQKLVHMGVPVTGIQIRGGLEDWFMHIINQDKQTA